MAVNLKFGIISEVLADKGLVRVSFPEEEMVSFPIPPLQRAVKSDKYYSTFEINEHVACLMDAKCEHGVVLGAIYDSKNLPGESSKTLTKVSFSDGTSVSYDKSASELEVNVGTTTVKVSGAGVEISKSGDSLAQILADWITLNKTETHISTAPGNPTTPNPAMVVPYDLIVNRLNNLLS